MTKYEKIGLNIKCPSCKADILTHEYGNIEDIMHYKSVFECVFCGFQFYDHNLVALQRKIKIKKICQQIKKIY